MLLTYTPQQSKTPHQNPRVKYCLNTNNKLARNRLSAYILGYSWYFIIFGEGLTKVVKCVLTAVLKYDKIVLWHTGIVVCLPEQTNSVIARYINNYWGVQQNKKQNKKQFGQNSPTVPIQLNTIFAGAILRYRQKVIETFCFLNRRLFVLLPSVLAKRSKIKTKNKNQKTNVSRSLSTPRHFAANRSQQNHADPLGRRGANPQSQARQSRVALLFPRPSRRNFETGQRNRLLPQPAWKIYQLERTSSVECQQHSTRLSLWSFFIGDVGRTKQEVNDLLFPSRGAKNDSQSFICQIYVLGQTKNNNAYLVDKKSVSFYQLKSINYQLLTANY